jgi:hypothetical protein
MFTPGNSHQDREQKIDMGLASLLTMSIVLLMLTDYIPKENTKNFPFLGELFICLNNNTQQCSSAQAGGASDRSF